jgi:serine/threonine protein kinase
MNPGNLLRNRYRIEKALAAGGFGEIYLAIDLDDPGQRRMIAMIFSGGNQACIQNYPNRV